MSGDPADVRHTPIDVLRMNVLIIPGRSRDVRHIATGAVLTSLRFARRAARVHQEQRRLGIHRQRIDFSARELSHQLVDEVVAAGDHRRR